MELELKTRAEVEAYFAGMAMAVRFYLNLDRLEQLRGESCPNCFGTGQIFPVQHVKGRKYSGPLVECVLCKGVGRIPKEPF